MPYVAYGIAMNEFALLDCTIRLHLDPDTSSAAPPTDWQSLPLCSPGALMVSDTDATYHSGYRTDSIRLRLLAPAPDIPLEYLTATASGAVGASGQGTGWLTLAAAAGTALVSANADYQAALRSARWHNDAASPTPGLRTVEIIAYASDGRSDTSYAYLPVQALRSAGQDTALAVCADAPPFSLLAPNGATGGAWSPPLAGGVFSPQADLPGTFSYTVGNGLCPADTAFVTVAVRPLPAFSLGQDTAACAHQLPLALAAPGTALWQDGSSANSFAAAQPGLYWAEFAGANGCRFRDSLTLTLKPSAQIQSSAQPCHGQPYVWGGQTFSTDTAVCATFAGLNGCDSTHCLALTFFYPSLSLDTSICSGQTLAWLGQDYAASGIFADTVLLGGCLTATSLNLEVRLPDTVSQSVSICNGQDYTVGGQTFSASGQYLVALQTPAGCDTVLRLALTFFYPSLSLDTSICSGQTLAWLGQNYAASGVYADTVLLGGCLTATLLDLEVLPPDTVSQSVSICNGKDYTVGGQIFSASGQYLVPLQTAAGCDTVLRLDLTVRPPAQSALSASICPGGEYVFGGKTLAQPGTYAATLQTPEGCDSTVTLALGLLPAPAPLVAGDTSLCDGDSAVLSTGLFAAYAWAGGGSTAMLEVSAAGVYAVTVTDANGCTATASATVTELPPMVAEWLAGDPLCHGDSTGFVELTSISGGAGPLSFSLNGWAPTDVPVFGSLPAGDWEVVATDAAGCTATFAFALADPPALAVDLGPSPELAVGDTYPIPVTVNQSGVFAYAWSPPIGLDCADCPSPVATAREEIAYMLLLTNADGCEASDSLRLRIKRSEGAYVPNVFSPDGDGQNDWLAIFGNPAHVLAVGLFRVYDRWGELVFESKALALNDERSGWDGRHRGQNALPGVYVWYAEIRLIDGSVVKRSGEVTVAR
ncbi:MAG: gliding motility-associated C-terminal domain-containing protein [Saprospiraceae bacterium]